MAKYQFVKFTVNGTDFAGTPIGTNMQLGLQVLSDLTVVAVYQDIIWTLTMLTPTGQGTVSPTGSQNAPADTPINISATAASGWIFSHWLIDGVNSGSANPGSVTKTSGTHTAQAVFVQQQTWTLTMLTPTGQGTVSPTGSQTALTDTPINISATAASGWTFSHWLVNGVNLSISNPGSLTRTSGTYTVKAVFTQNPVIRTFTLGIVGEGAVNHPTGSSLKNDGTATTITATASPDWLFYTFILDDVGNMNNPITVQHTSDHTLLAVFTHQPTTDTLRVTYTNGYTIWESASIHDFYVKLKDVEVQGARFSTIDLAMAYVDGKSTPIVKVITLAGAGVGLYLILTRV